METRGIERTELEANTVETGIKLHRWAQEGNTFIQGDISLTLTSSKEPREEQCGNCFELIFTINCLSTYSIYTALPVHYCTAYGRTRLKTRFFL